MTLEVEQKDNITLIKVAGRLDTLTSRDFDKQVGELGDFRGDLVIDGAKMEYISSAGLRSFISLLKKVKASGHTLEVVNLTADVRPIFDMTGCSSLFNLK